MMTKSPGPPQRPLKMNRSALILAAAWTAFIAGLAIWDSRREMKNARGILVDKARTHFFKDQAFRYWSARHGGVYVPIDDRTLPNPHLAHIPERDITTPSGKKLTLMNPAYMLRQMMEEQEDLYGEKGHITSLNPLRPRNAPDAWERKALEAFEQGAKEVSEFTDIDGESRLRLIRPMITRKTCLKCHAIQGYKEGEIRGGVSISVQGGRQFSLAKRNILNHSTGLGFIWLLGLGCLLAGVKHLTRRVEKRDRDRAEAAVNSEHEQLLSIFDSMDEVVYIADPHTYELLYGNGAIKKIWGTRTGEKCHKVLQNRDSPCPFCTNHLIFGENLGKTHIWEFQNEVTHRWYRCIDRAIHWPRDRMVRFEMAIDITETRAAQEDRLKLERKIQQAQKTESLGVLAGGIAHDFNNILMAVLGYADLTIQDLPPHSPALQHVREIEKAARRAADLSRQMLAYSGKGKFVVEPIHLNKFVEEMVHILQVSISRKAVLKLNYADNLPVFDGDVTQIRQVIMNLITNASEAIGDRSGVIAISTGAMECDRTYLDTGNPAFRQEKDEDLIPGVYVYFEVADTGSGMDRKTLEKVFDPFFTTKFTGRGLGMAAVLGIVRGHRGTIKVYSEPRKGTTFKVLFPVSRSAEILHEPANPRAGPGDFQAVGTVLIADDEESVCTLGRLTLERIGYTVLTATDGREAIEIFRRHAEEITCVLLDLTMPHLDGEEVFREMRHIRPSVKVILSSGYNEQDATQQFSGKGLAGFIQKPYTPTDLVTNLKSILGAGTEGGNG